MNRRRFLVSAAAAGASASLAGCSGSGDDGSSAQRDPNNEVTDKLYTAVGELNTAALSLATAAQNVESPEEIEFDPSGPRERVSRANEALDAAAEADSGSHGRQIEQVRTYATRVSSMIGAAAGLLSGAAKLADLKGEFDPQNADQARQAIEASREPLKTAVSETEKAKTARQNADADVLTDLDATYQRVTGALEDLVGYVAGFDGLSRGYQTLLDGVDAVQQAQQQFDDKAYRDALASFETARSDFADAERTFETARSDAPKALDERLGRGVQRSAGLKRLSGGYTTMLGGMTDLETGRRQFENEKYQQAADSFASAGSAFRDADTTFAAESSDSGGAFQTQFETARCRTEHLVAAADHLESAANAADDGDLLRAKNESEKGKQEIQRARNC